MLGSMRFLQCDAVEPAVIHHTSCMWAVYTLALDRTEFTIRLRSGLGVRHRAVLMYETISAL